MIEPEGSGASVVPNLLEEERLLALQPVCLERAWFLRGMLTARPGFTTPVFNITDCESRTAPSNAVKTGYTVSLRIGIGLIGPMLDPGAGQQNTRTLAINQVWLNEADGLVNIGTISEIDPTPMSTVILYQDHEQPTGDELAHLNMLLEDAQLAVAAELRLAGRQRMQGTGEAAGMR